MKKSEGEESRRSLEDLQEIARVATREALLGFPEVRRLLPELVLGILFDGDDRIFELYIPGDRPEDACVISRVRVDSHTGEAVTEIFTSNINKLVSRP